MDSCQNAATHDRLSKALLYLVGTATLLASACAPGYSQGQIKKSEELPERLLNAKYIYVEAYDGDAFDPRLLPEDRKAIVDVESAIQKWGHYQLTMRRSEAEIVIQIRKGRLASIQGRIAGSVGSVPTGVQFPPKGRTESGTTVGGGAEVGPPDDVLGVYEVDPQGKLSTLYWRRMAKNGLKPPKVELLQQFKDQVEAAAAVHGKKKAATAAPGAKDPNASHP